MRVSTTYQYGTYVGDIAQAQERLVTLQRQISTGKKYSSIGEDPMGVTSSLSLKSLRDSLGQYQKNLTSAKGQLGLEESALSETNLLVQRAYTLAVSGANGATDQSSRNAMVNELNEIQSRLIDLGNAQGANGQYLFAGQKTDQKPFTLVSSTLTFVGDDFDRAVEAAPGETLVASVQGRPIFLNAYNAVENLKKNLQGNSTAIGGEDIPALQMSMGDINATRGQIGARLQSAESWISDHNRRRDEFESEISDIEDVDITETIVRYQTAQAAYSGALAVASQGFGLGLIDFLK